MYSSQGLDLDILPSGSPSVIRRYRQSIETETFRTAGNVRNRGIHLPVRGGAIALGASDEALGALALVGEVSEWRAGAVDKGTGRGARGDGARVSGGEAEGTAGVNVDALAAGDGDVLCLSVHFKPGEYRAGRTKAFALANRVVVPGGQPLTFSTGSGQKVEGDSPSQKLPWAAFMGSKWMGEPERADMTENLVLLLVW